MTGAAWEGANNRLLKLFISAWLAYIFLHLVAPAKSNSPNEFYSWVLVAIYITIAIITVLALSMAMRSSTPVKEIKYESNASLDSVKFDECVIIAATVLSAVGLFLHLYDKVFIMQLDYGAGLNCARYRWLESGSGRVGVSSWQSAAGHILVNFYFVAICVSVLRWEHIRTHCKTIGLVVGLVLMFAYSLSIGTRSVPIVVLAFLLSVCVLRKAFGKSFVPNVSLSGAALYIGLIGFLFVAYSTSVFSGRAECNKSNSFEYTRSFFLHLGAMPKPVFERSGTLPKIIEDTRNYSVLTSLYIIHTQWTFQNIIDLKQRRGEYFIGSVLGGLSKIGFKIDINTKRAIKGRLLSVPGAAWYWLGVLGVIIVAIVHGIVIFFAEYIVKSSRKGYLGPVIYTFVGTFSVLSPLTSIGNLMVFPFMVIALLSLLFIHWSLKYYMTWRDVWAK